MSVLSAALNLFGIQKKKTVVERINEIPYIALRQKLLTIESSLKIINANKSTLEEGSNFTNLAAERDSKPVSYRRILNLGKIVSQTRTELMKIISNENLPRDLKDYFQNALYMLDRYYNVVLMGNAPKKRAA